MTSTPRRTSRATEPKRRPPGESRAARPATARRGRYRVALLLAGMAALSVSSLAWLGLRGARFERERVRLRLEAAAEDSLGGIAAVAGTTVRDAEEEIDAALAAVNRRPEAARQAARADPLIRQVFWRDAEGRLVYPSTDQGDLGSREREFLDRTRGVWEQGLPAQARTEGSGSGKARGSWYTWAWGSGVAYLYWRVEPDRWVVGAEVESAALLGRLIAALPSTPLEGALPARVVLAAQDGEILYQWGVYEPSAGEPPLAVRRLDPPFASWTLAYHARPGEAGAAGGLPLGLSIAAVALVLVGGAALLWRESTREAREAGRRVSFVNHVSHELKTPLTNILLYAELVQAGLEKMSRRTTGAELREKVDVIVDESRRLSRLIHNVLTFARRDRGSLAVTRAPGVVDELVSSVLEDFRPRLEQAGIRVVVSSGAPGRVWVDTDAVEQILANLVGNAEKYAAAGGHLGIETRQTPGETTIRVADHGPGVPARLRARVFDPFYRVSDRLTDPSAGTGIGLTIARDLARLHGGDLRLQDPADGRGACFVLTLGTPPVEDTP